LVAQCVDGLGPLSHQELEAADRALFVFQLAAQLDDDRTQASIFAFDWGEPSAGPIHAPPAQHSQRFFFTSFRRRLRFLLESDCWINAGPIDTGRRLSSLQLICRTVGGPALS